MNTRRAFFESFLVVLTLVVVIINLVVITGALSKTNQFLIIFLASIVLVLLPVFLLLLIAFPERKSYHVAVIGFPKSGKTTLIISLFGEAFARKLPINVTPRGSQTIERVNKSLEMLRKGKTLGPTHDQDMFAFRADATVGRFPFGTTYRIEFGDFPGKYSQERDRLASLHDTEFFKWLADSDSIMFVIDLGPYLSKVGGGNYYVAEVTATFRAEWQQYLDANRYRIKEVKRHPIIIVFNKADLMYRYSAGVKLDDIEKMTGRSNVVSLENMIQHFGFGENVPPTIEIEEKEFKSDKKTIESKFAELITYFEAEADNCNIVFTSSFALMKGKTLGINELFSSVLKGAS